MHTKIIRLGVNIDHVATIRQARETMYPDPIYASLIAEAHGADGITVHLREDRRHIQVRDVELLNSLLQIPMNLEMAATEAMIDFAEKIRPKNCCLVPEKRQELTTEGGLAVCDQIDPISRTCERLSACGIQVSLFIDPDEAQIDAAIACGAPVVELHTGCYADAASDKERALELSRIVKAVTYAAQKGLIVNAGHGLNYHNVLDVAEIPEIYELNIGHSIIAKALFVGMEQAVKDMKQLMLNARKNV